MQYIHRIMRYMIQEYDMVNSTHIYNTVYYTHIVQSTFCKTVLHAHDGHELTCLDMMSGDSSAVRRWPVDQEAVNSNPTNAEINVCRALALRVYLAQPAFSGQGPPHRAGTFSMDLCPSLFVCGPR